MNRIRVMSDNPDHVSVGDYVVRGGVVTMSVLVTTSVVETRTVAETLSVSKWSGVRAGAEQRPAKQLIRQQYEEVLVFPGIVFNIGQQSDASGRSESDFQLLTSHGAVSDFVSDGNQINGATLNIGAVESCV